jgi:hypothetical protein
LYTFFKKLEVRVMEYGNLRCPDCGRPMIPTACTCETCGIRVEGSFSLSPLAFLSPEDQALVIAFIRSYGSIKRIGEILGVSHPTARSRIQRLVESINRIMEAPPEASAVLELLERGEISFDEAMERL